MRDARRILVGVDGSEAARDALDWACHFATKSGMEVRALMAWHQAALSLGVGPADENTGEIVLAHLREIVASAGHPDVEIQAVERQPAVGLLEAGGAPDVALMVLGRRGIGTLTDLLLGSVARSVLHAPPVPVVLVPRRPADGWPDPARIVVAIDGSDLSRDVIDAACSLSTSLSVTPSVVHCIDVGAEFSTRLLDEVLERTRSIVRDRWCDRLDADDAEIDVRNAEARRGIVEAASEQGAGLVVVGLHGAGQFRGIGGTTSYLARHLTAPLVVVPPSEKVDHRVGYRL